MPPPRGEGEEGEAAVDAHESARARVKGWSQYIFGVRRAYGNDGSLLIEIMPPIVKTMMWPR